MKDEKKNKRQERRDRARQRDQSSRLRTMGLIAVGAAILVYFFISQQLAAIRDVVAAEIEPKEYADGNSMGDPNAPIKIVEYSDFQCPFCERFAVDTEPLLEANFIATGKVYFTYRSAGNWVSGNLGGLRTESQDAAAAAYCAGDQNKFWEMHAALFANNRDVEDQGSFTARRLSAIAEKAGLDMTEWQECFDSGKYTDRVQQDYDDAIEAGIEGTPYFVVTYTVDGETRTETINGAQPITEFQRVIEAALLIADQPE